MMTITRIVSGGQTGADRGGLEAAIYCGLPYGGWIPRGRLSEDGGVPQKYGALREMAQTGYPPRTRANAADSDATVVFCHGRPDGGSKLTVDAAHNVRRPCLAVDLDLPREDNVRAIVRWLREDCPAECVLNVAGSRESKARGIEQDVMAIVVDVLRIVNGARVYPVASRGPDPALSRRP